MLDRFKQALGRWPGTDARTHPALRWATGQFLHPVSRGPGQFVITGRLLDRVLRVECLPSSRPYIQGLELRARIDLDLPPQGHVIVMTQAVHQALEVQADELYARSVNTVQTTAHDMPEELRWLSLFRPTRWSGPPEAFWARYRVLTDAVGLARRWLDDEAMAFLMAGDPSVGAEVPLVVMLMRGRCYLRLQVNPHAGGADTLLALEMLEHLSRRALALAGRAAPGGPASGLNSPG